MPAGIREGRWCEQGRRIEWTLRGRERRGWLGCSACGKAGSGEGREEIGWGAGEWGGEEVIGGGVFLE